MKARFLSLSIAAAVVLLAPPAWSEAEIEGAGATAEEALTEQAEAASAEAEEALTEQAEAASAMGEETPSGRVERSSVTTAIADREPQDSVTEISTDLDQIYYFTEIRGMTGQTVTHRWEFGGEVLAEVPFEVGGPRWRVYSSKDLIPAWLGEWKVSAIDAAGRVLSSDTFTYAQASAPAEAPMAETAPEETLPPLPEEPASPETPIVEAAPPEIAPPAPVEAPTLESEETPPEETLPAAPEPGL
jgi:hypothetical protein